MNDHDKLMALPGKWRSDRTHFATTEDWSAGYNRAKNEDANELDVALAALGGDGEARKPDGYAYRYRDAWGSERTAILFNDGRELNGNKPIEAVPYFFGSPPTQPEAKGEAVAIPADSVDGELSVEQAINDLCEMHPGADRLAMKLLAALFTHRTVVRYKAGTAAPKPVEPARKLSAWVGDMRAGGLDSYYVCVGYGKNHGEYMTPNHYRIRGRAEYDVAEWNHLLGLGPEPDILAYDTEPTGATAAQQQGETADGR